MLCLRLREAPGLQALVARGRAEAAGAGPGDPQGAGAVLQRTAVVAAQVHATATVRTRRAVPWLPEGKSDGS